MQKGSILKMDKILFSKRLKKRRTECGFSSANSFAAVYNRRFLSGDTELAGNNPYAGILGTIKNYENQKHPGMPRLDIVANMCILLDCDIDYLLGYIESPKHVHETMYKTCGLSQKSTDRLLYWNKHNFSGIVNIFLESDNLENAIEPAIRLMKVKPTLEGLQEILQSRRKKGEDDNSALLDAISAARKKCDLNRHRLGNEFTHLIDEIERISLEKTGTKTAQCDIDGGKNG